MILYPRRLKRLQVLPNLMKSSEVASVLRVSVITVKRWEKKGVLEALRINSRGDRRFRKEDIIKHLGVV